MSNSRKLMILALMASAVAVAFVVLAILITFGFPPDYRPQDISIEQVVADDRKIVVKFRAKSESMWVCSGVTVAKNGNLHLVRFKRGSATARGARVVTSFEIEKTDGIQVVVSDGRQEKRIYP